MNKKNANQPVTRESPPSPPPSRKVVQEKGYQHKPHYNESQVDVGKFNKKYSSFIADDEQNKKDQTRYLDEYLENTGLAMGFKIICAEVLSKNIPPEEILSYTTGRLRELGSQVDKLKTNPQINHPQASHPQTSSPTKK